MAVLSVQRRGCGTCIKAVRLLNLLKNYVNEMLSFQNSAYLFAVFLHDWPNIPVSTLSAVCGDDLLGDGGHVPRYHQHDDVSHWESRPAYRGISELQKGMALSCSIYSWNDCSILQVSISSVPCECVRTRILHIHTCVWSCPQAGTIANISSSIVNLGLILLMGRVYTALAEQLTKWGKSQYCRLTPQTSMMYIDISLLVDLQ